MPSLYEKLSKEMSAAGIKPRTDTARAWLFSKMQKLKIPSNRGNLLNDPKRGTGFALIGKMYFFHYDPKYKETLPMYDRFPLVLPMDLYSDGFLGINLHYLDPYTRLYLLDLLHDFINNDKYDDTTRFKLAYRTLNASKRYNLIKPCIKRYLFEHVMSSMIYIEPDSWETAIFLPTEKMVYNQ
jgi:hypothetical protein